LLPYRVFSKDQRVSHTAVVENKRLGHALALVKAQQDVKHQPKVATLGSKKPTTKQELIAGNVVITLREHRSLNCLAYLHFGCVCDSIRFCDCLILIRIAVKQLAHLAQVISGLDRVSSPP
jgi:hypothetical protein